MILFEVQQKKFFFSGGPVKKLGLNFVAAEDKLIKPATVKPSQWGAGTSTASQERRSINSGHLLDNQPGLWIRIDLIRIRIQHFYSIRIRFQIQIQAKTELSKTISQIVLKSKFE
jgi:hypothetical protein